MLVKTEKFAVDTDVQLMLFLTVSKDGDGRCVGAGERDGLLRDFQRLIMVSYRNLEPPPAD